MRHSRFAALLAFIVPAVVACGVRTEKDSNRSETSEQPGQPTSGSPALKLTASACIQVDTSFSNFWGGAGLGLRTSDSQIDVTYGAEGERDSNFDGCWPQGTKVTFIPRMPQGSLFHSYAVSTSDEFGTLRPLSSHIFQACLFQQGPCTVTLDRSYWIQAKFAKKTQTITVSRANASQSARVKCIASGNTMYGPTVDVTLSGNQLVQKVEVPSNCELTVTSNANQTVVGVEPGNIDLNPQPQIFSMKGSVLEPRSFAVAPR